MIKWLRYRKGVIACDEVSTYYGSISDVLAVDIYKGIVMEFEFKATLYDLKNDFKKEKYQEQPIGTARILRGNKIIPKRKQDPLRPHKFYFVVKWEFYKKNKEYLDSLEGLGIVTYTNGLDFYFSKRCYNRKSRVYKPKVVERQILKRLNSIYTEAIDW